MTPRTNVCSMYTQYTVHSVWAAPRHGDARCHGYTHTPLPLQTPLPSAAAAPRRAAKPRPRSRCPYLSARCGALVVARGTQGKCVRVCTLRGQYGFVETWPFGEGYFAVSHCSVRAVFCGPVWRRSCALGCKCDDIRLAALAHHPRPCIHLQVVWTLEIRCRTTTHVLRLWSITV